MILFSNRIYICCTFVLALKKTSIILFAFFYLILSSGFALNIHYCGGKLKNVTFFQDEEKGCCGTKKKSMGCCKNHAFVHHVKEKPSPVNIVKAPDFTYQLLSIVSSTVIFNLPDNNSFFKQFYFLPPVLYDNAIYLKNRVLII